jgi:aspartyl-tRNA(Asn)/glutamyl-tRNA(Gln) amidotransferase subunit A
MAEGEMRANWQWMGAAELGRGIAAGDICPVALTETYLEAAESHPHCDRIFARLMRQQALDTAMAARTRAKAGLRRGPLDGVPVSWKDLFDTAGVATEAGTALLKGRVPAADATVVARLTSAGLPPIGKTHMTELAFSGLGLNPVTATPPWRHDPDHVPGGSSSGAAASVAFGLAPLAIGSDTGGSVRVPAGWNDLVGLKTTAGRFPAQGVVPLAARFDTVGPLARNVEDAALAFTALDDGPAPDLRGARLAGARLMVLETVALDDLDPAQARAFEAALDRLAAAGARIARRAVPAVAEAMDMAGILYTPECHATWRAEIDADPDAMFPPVRDRFRAGATHRADDYLAARLRLDALRADYARATAGFDAVLVPTNANMPPRIDALLADHAFFTSENLRTLRNTRIGNLMGGCALTLPAGSPGCGLSLMAPPMEEARLLRLGAAAEAALAG